MFKILYVIFATLALLILLIPFSPFYVIIAFFHSGGEYKEFLDSVKQLVAPLVKLYAKNEIK